VSRENNFVHRNSRAIRKFKRDFGFKKHGIKDLSVNLCSKIHPQQPELRVKRV